MGTKEKIETFNKRWDIISEEDYSIEFQKFKTRILNVLSEVDSNVKEEGIIHFCNLLGKPFKWEYYSQGKYSLNIIDAFNKENNENEFYRLIEYLFQIEFDSANPYLHNFKSFRENYINLIKEIIDYSNVNVTLLKKDGDIILTRKGEKAFDKKLVDDVVKFFDEKSLKHYTDALQQYRNNDPIKSAESLRRTLEEFLRYKLNNDRGLDGNISELQQRLKVDGKDSQVRNIIFQTFNYLDKYFNENSKHKDGDINEAENEYLIYQAGVLLRYIDKVIY